MLLAIAEGGVQPLLKPCPISPKLDRHEMNITRELDVVLFGTSGEGEEGQAERGCTGAQEDKGQSRARRGGGRDNGAHEEGKENGKRIIVSLLIVKIG